MTLTIQQQQALQQIQFFLDSSAHIFILKGYAGTGKTTLLSHIVSHLQEQRLPFQLMAPTGRAAKVIRNKTRLSAFTIHKSIYNFEAIEEMQDGDGFRLHFPLKINDGSHPVCIVDECSMVSAMISTHEIYVFGTGILMDDLLTYAAPHAGGKIIFIGDPAQLPPVGDANSRAFDEAYFQNRGLQTMSFELTQVLRQGDNAILRNATLCRKQLIDKQFSRLDFEQKTDEVETTTEVADEFCKRYDSHTQTNPVVITFSNKKASSYNKEIRKILFPDRKHVAADDLLMCVTNNYNHGTDIYNGDFLKVLKADDCVIIRHATVWVERAGKKVQQKVELRFRKAVVQLDSGEIIEANLLDSFLENENPSLTIAEIKALYIDFKTRNSKLKPYTEAFKNALKADQYYNALHVKYGYAITGHKSQGGEWNTVFVDYAGQYGNSVDSLRWIYTVTTRAKSLLLSPQFPQHKVFDKLRIDAISKANRLPDDFYPAPKSVQTTLSETKPTSPFHPASAPDFLKEKYQELSQAMAGTPFSIVGIVSCNYLEKYTIATPSGHFQYLGDYKKTHVFKFRPTPQCPENEAVLAIMNGSVQTTTANANPPLLYEPSTTSLQDLYEKVEMIGEQCGLDIVNITEYPSAFYVRYSFRSEKSCSYIDFFTDSKGYVTYGRPVSLLGNQDIELQNFIDLLNN